MRDCIFCKIVSGEIKSEFIYEDDKSVVIRDVNPRANTHLLILPKVHIDSIQSLETEKEECLMGYLITVGKKVAEDLKLKGYQLQINVGKEGGQEIFHIHIHLKSKFSS